MSNQKNPPTDDDLDATVQEASATDDRVSELETQVTEQNEQMMKAMDIAARSQAELQNAKIRLEREAQELRKFAAEGVLLRLLPTVDNLQRALKSLPEDIAKHSWVKGIVAVEQDFLKQVGDMGLKRFESLGQPVDAARHEVLLQGEGEAGTVTEIFEDGYELHGKVIRPAKVKAGGGSL